MGNKKKRKIKWRNILLLLFFIVSIIGLVYSIVNILIWSKDNKNVNKEIVEINEVIEIEEHVDNEATEVIEQEEEIPKFNPYWDYIKMNLIDVDFKELKDVNSNVIGWIQVGGTNINYPFVQANDNNYYLKHSFDKSYNQTGWLFMDYRNSNTEFDKNTIIYGHSLTRGTMFGTLKNILKNNWQSNTNNHIVKLSTEYENTLWQVFSIYTIPNTSDYLKINFSTDDDFKKFTDLLIGRSEYNFNTSVGNNDKILTLSSCYKNSDNKIVLHAKLIKAEKK